MRGFQRMAVILLSMVLCPSSLFAADLRVALFDVAPYASELKSGGAAGIYVDLAKRISNKAGLGLSVEVVPFARVPYLLEQNQADFTIGFATDALAATSERLVVVRTVNASVLMAAGRVVERVEDLRGLEIGRLRGGCKDLADRQDLATRFYEVNALTNGLRMLTVRRLAGLCATQDVIEYYLAQEGMRAADFGTLLKLSQREVWVHVRKGLSQDMQQLIRRAVAELRKEGRL